MVDDDRIAELVEQGRQNERVLQLAHNWCAHLETERWGGVGLVEQMHDLPISARRFKCQYAEDDGVITQNVKKAVLRFYDRNCQGCQERQPVRTPNLLKLVQERDRERQRQKRLKEEAERRRQRKFEERDEKRAELIDDVDNVTRDVINLIRKLDREGGRDVADRLVETAKASPELFGSDITELVLDVGAAGGAVKAEAALEVLKTIDADDDQLAQLSVAALERGDAMRTAGPILVERLDHVEDEELADALPALIALAAPPRRIISGPMKPADPRPLILAYSAQPKVTTEVLKRGLRSDSVFARREACYAARTLFHIDEPIIEKLAEDVVRVLFLPDNYREIARSAATKALAAAFRYRPEAIDSLLDTMGEHATNEEEARLFKVVDVLLRDPPREDKESVPVEARRVAMGRIVSALSDTTNPDRLRQAQRTLGSYIDYWPGTVTEFSEELVGALLIQTEAANQDFEGISILDPESSVLEGLDQYNRSLAARNASSAIASKLGQLASSFPESTGEVLIDIYENIEEGREALRARIIEALGEMATRPALVQRVLPKIYGALVDRSQTVRAAGATAYGELVDKVSGELPNLLHESFLILFRDPYVIVHRSAVRAVRFNRLPDRLHPAVCNSLLTLIGVYATTHQEDAFLGNAIDAYLQKVSYGEDLEVEEKVTLLGILGNMDPNEAWDVIEHRHRIFSGLPGYAGLLISIMMHDDTYSFHAAQPLSSLEDCDEEEVLRVREKLPEVARRVRKKVSGDLNEGDPTYRFIQLLSNVGAWRVAGEVAQDHLNELEDGRWSRTRRLYMKGVLAAIRLEAAVKDGGNSVEQQLEVWEEVKAEYHGHLDDGPRKQEIFWPAYESRIEVLSELAEGLKNGAAPDALDEAAASLAGVAESVRNPTRESYKEYAELAHTGAMLLRWRDAVLAAESEANRFKTAATQRALKLQKEASSRWESRWDDAVESLHDLSDVSDVVPILERSVATPLPLPLQQRRKPSRQSSDVGTESDTNAEPPCVAVMSLRLDGEKIESPHTVIPDVTYDLDVQLSLSRWPSDADRIVLQPVSVDELEEYSLTSFVFEKPDGTPPYRLKNSGRFRVQAPQSLRSRPLQFSYLIFPDDASSSTIEEQGQYQFEVRCLDREKTPISPSREVDRRVEEIGRELRQSAFVPQYDVVAFQNLMAVLGSIAYRQVTDAFIEGEWDESDFQDLVRDEARRIPQIGSRLEVHPNTGGGETDLSLDQVRLELKVVRENRATVDRVRENYFDQLVQYVVGSDRRVGVFGVLDMTEQDEPPEPVGDAMHLIEYSSEDASGPVHVGLVIIRGNLARPSDHSQ